MGAAFLYKDLVAGAAFVGNVGAAAVDALPLSNLSDPQPRVRTRWQPASSQIYIDFGATVTIGCVALIGTTFTEAGTPNMRVEFGHDAGMGTTTWSSGAFLTETNAAANGNVIAINPTDSAGRYMIVTISDADASYLDVGRLVAGPLFRPTYSWSYGAGEGRLILDRRDRNGFTGAEFPVPAVVNPRMMNFTLGAITNAEAIGEFRTMRDTLGAVGDALWIPDDGLSLSELNRRCIWGATSQPGESSVLTRANLRLHSRTFSIVERV